MPGNVVRLVFAGDAKDLDKAATSGSRSLNKFKSSVDDVNASLRNSAGGFRGMSNSLGALPNLFDGAKNAALKGGLDLGSQVADGMSKGVMGASRGLAGPGGAIAAAVAAPIALFAAGQAGVAVGGAIVAGLGAGLAGIGLMFASRSEKVQTEVRALTDFVSKEMTRISKPFEGTILTILPMVKSVFQTFASEFEAVAPGLATSITHFMTFVKSGFDQLAPAIRPITEAFQQILKDLGPELPFIFQTIANSLVQLANNVKDNSEFFVNLIVMMGHAISVGLEVINWLISLARWLDDTGRSLAAFHQAVGNAFMNAARAATQWIHNLIVDVASIPGRVLSAIGNLGNLLWNAGASIIQGLINGIWSKIGEVRSALANLTSMLPSWKGPLTVDAKLLVENGQVIMDSLVRGFKAGEPAVKGYLNGLTSSIGARGTGAVSTAPATTGGAVTITFAGNADQGVASLVMKLIREGKIQIRSTT